MARCGSDILYMPHNGQVSAAVGSIKASGSEPTKRGCQQQML
jgi:hypothetical protein